MIQTDAQYLLVYEAINEHIQQHDSSKKSVRVISASSLLENTMIKPHSFRSQRGRSVSAVSGGSNELLCGDDEETDNCTEANDT
jgi:hypothetical protein